MPNAAQTRLLDDMHHPRIAEIWRAMAGLRSVVGFLNSGAHPDDETSEMLAALWLRDGINLSYACSTRGEGGQNDIGTEGGTVLGTLRTAEMEAAAQVLDMRLYWHGQSIDDPVTDFGFSKSGIETMGRWGRDRLMRRFVEIVRQDRPDIICPTFLDIPGQHGHHRAMTEAAHAVVATATDPAFVTEGLAPWQVSKLYLPAWSGAGGAYDDELPPPPATITVAGEGVDPNLGHSYARIGQHSRQFHRTQGMGRWVSEGEERDWPLHLAWSGVGEDACAITDNLPRDLADIGCGAAQSALGACLAAFPDGPAMAREGTRAIAALQDAQVAPDHAHRVARKIAQLSRVVRLAAGIEARARPIRSVARPGERVDVTREQRQPIVGEVAVSIEPGARQSVAGTAIDIAPDAPVSDPYPDSYDPLAPRAPFLKVAQTIDGVSITSHVALESPILVVPTASAALADGAAILNRGAGAESVAVQLAEALDGEARFDLPEGWSQDWSGTAATVTPPPAAEGAFDLPLRLDGTAAITTRIVDHAHVAPRLHATPARLRLRIVSVTPPEARIGYVGAGNDRVAHWLRAAGFDVIELDDASLASTEPFAGIDTVLVGVFAYRFRPALKPATGALNDWVAQGGTLVTLYHRPWDDWDPDVTPPARLEIGQPSLRWRITDETVEVGLLAPDHPVLAGPNPIGPDDWQGWHKERGLYFAKSWDAAYTPLLRMADPDEQPLDGGLLVGEIGAGRHVHVALNLHHQVAQLVPGAYRLFANLLTPRRVG